MPFLPILLTRSRYRRLSRLLSLSLIYHAETVSSSRNLLVAAYTLYYHTTPAVETHLLQRYIHHVMTSVCTPVLFDNYLSLQPFVAFLHYSQCSSSSASTIYIHSTESSLSHRMVQDIISSTFTPLTGTSPRPAHHRVQTHTKRQI